MTLSDFNINRPCGPIAPMAILIGLLSLAFHAQPVSAAPPDSYADSVYDSSNLSTNPVYDDPSAALGRPSTKVFGKYDQPKGVYHASMVYSPYNKSPAGNNLLVNLGTSGNGEVTVAFDHRIHHEANHWYGDDFIVFGNPVFTASQPLTPTTDMTQVTIEDGNIYQSGMPTVSVSLDGKNFVALTPDGTFWPSNPYQWTGITSNCPSGWGAFADFTKPVDPSVVPSDFAGDTVADASDNLYNGSAGGEAFTLAGTQFETSGIKYIRFSGKGNVDAVSRVGFDPSAAPESAAQDDDDN